MKKFMKGCGISALLLIAVGVTLGMAGRSVAGQNTIKEVVETVTDGRVRMDAGNWLGWNIGFNSRFGQHNIGIFTDEICVAEEAPASSMQAQAVDRGTATTYIWSESTELYDIDDAFDFDDDYSVYRGDVAKYRLGSGIHNLDIEFGGGNFIIEPSDDDNFYIETTGSYSFQGFVEDDTLYVKSFNPVNVWYGSGDVILYIPEGYFFQEVEIEIGAGYLGFSDLNAREVSLEVGAGGIDLECLKAQELEVSVGAGWVYLTDMEVGELDVEVGMGEFTAEGAVWGNADVECAMGNVDMGMAGSETDFNYYLEGAMGNIIVGDDNYISNRVAQEKTVQNNASKDMDIECSMGNVTVWFMN